MLSDETCYSLDHRSHCLDLEMVKKEAEIQTSLAAQKQDESWLDTIRKLNYSNNNPTVL